MREVEVLILDDLGAEQSTPWASEKLFQLLNYRYSVMLLLITHNMPRKDTLHFFVTYLSNIPSIVHLPEYALHQLSYVDLISDVPQALQYPYQR